MRIFLLLGAALILFFQSSFAKDYTFTTSQTIVITHPDPILGLGQGIIGFKNTASTSITLTYTMIKNTIPSQVSLQLCDWEQCRSTLPAQAGAPLSASATGTLTFDVNPDASVKGIDTLQYLLAESGNPGGDTLTFVVNFTSLGVNEAEYSRQEFKLYPNPVLNLLYLGSSQNESLKASIYNLSGKLILSYAGKLNSVDVSLLPGGFYFIRLEDENGRISSSPFIKSE